MIEIFRLGICDDDEGYVRQEEEVVRSCFEELGQPYEVVHFSSGEELIGAAAEGHLPLLQLLLLDIEMQDVDGIQVKNYFSNRPEVKRILFTSSHQEAMPMAFGLRVIGFLVKPFDREELARWIRVVIRELGADELITYEDGMQPKRIYLEDIRYIQGEKEYSYLHRTGEQEPELIRKTVKGWEKLLNQPCMVRVHKSYLVNLAHVRRIEAAELVMKDTKERIPIGRTYRENVRKQYMTYQMEIARGRL